MRVLVYFTWAVHAIFWWINYSPHPHTRRHCLNICGRHENFNRSVNKNISKNITYINIQLYLIVSCFQNYEQMKEQSLPTGLINKKTIFTLCFCREKKKFNQFIESSIGAIQLEIRDCLKSRRVIHFKYHCFAIKNLYIHTGCCEKKN